MKETQFLNKKEIKKVTICQNIAFFTCFLKHEPAKKFLFIEYQKEIEEGFYRWTYDLHGKSYTKINNLSNYDIIDNKLYNKPLVTIYFSEKLYSEVYFDTFEKAIKFCSENFNEYLIID